jgi:4'-phosphopantetheinyl transferase
MTPLPNQVPAIDTSVTVQFWHASASEGEPGRVESYCESLLLNEERERALVFRRDTSRNQHVVGRGMTRRLLATPDVMPHSIRFASWPHGRPYAVFPAQVCHPFNISHTHGLVVAALVKPDTECSLSGRDGLVGVDVEKWDRRLELGLADRFFSPPEIDYVYKQSGETNRRWAFLRIWTLKESFIKAIGTGLHTPLAAFAFRDVDTDCPKIEMLDESLASVAHWRFYAISPRPDYLAAVAIGCANAGITTQLTVSRFEDLLPIV